MTRPRSTLGQRVEQVFSEVILYPREPSVPVVQMVEKKSESQFPTEPMG